ncbi:hypothetical protein ACFLR3_03620 [Campylobacterota bacterium]
MSLKQQLADIDLQLEVMSEQNRKMLFASILIGTIVFVYYFFGLTLQEEVESKEATVSKLEKKLAENKVSLFENKIRTDKQQILLLLKEYENEQYKATALRTKLERMDYLSSDAKGLADILERILKQSVVLNVNIDKITLDNAHKKYTEQIERQGQITIEGAAAFKSVLKLLRFVESQEALIEVGNVHFELVGKESDLPNFVLVINGYGIRL